LTLPKIAYANESRRHDLTLSYQPEFELYQHNSDQNGMNQEATGSFNYFFKRNMQISIGDSYRQSHDPARTLQNVFLLLPRSRYSDNTLQASFEVQPNQLTSFGVRYDNSYTKFGQTDQFQTRITDTKTTGYTFTLTRMLSRNHRLRGMYSILKVVPINQAKTADDRVDTTYSFEKPIHSATLQYRVRLSPGTTVEASGGVVKLDTGTNYTFRGSIDKRFATFYWVSASYSRSLAYMLGTPNGFAQGLGSSGFYDVVVVRFNGQPSRRTAFLIDTSFSHGASSRVVEASQSFLGRGRFDYRLNDRNVLFTQVESYQQNRNAYVLAPLTRTRFMVGVEISFSTEAQRRNSRLNQDTRYVDITDHPRHRDDDSQQED
jgi:hypothetical protein